MQTEEWGRRGKNYTFALIVSLLLTNFQGFPDPGGVCVFWISQIDSSSLSQIPVHSALNLYKALSQQHCLETFHGCSVSCGKSYIRIKLIENFKGIMWFTRIYLIFQNSLRCHLSQWVLDASNVFENRTIEIFAIVRGLKLLKNLAQRHLNLRNLLEKYLRSLQLQRDWNFDCKFI